MTRRRYRRWQRKWRLALGLVPALILLAQQWGPDWPELAGTAAVGRQVRTEDDFSPPQEWEVDLLNRFEAGYIQAYEMANAPFRAADPDFRRMAPGESGRARAMAQETAIETAARIYFRPVVESLLAEERMTEEELLRSLAAAKVGWTARTSPTGQIDQEMAARWRKGFRRKWVALPPRISR